MLSSRPSARIARSSRRCRPSLSSRGGSGSSGFGTNARTSSPPTRVTRIVRWALAASGCVYRCFNKPPPI